VALLRSHIDKSLKLVTPGIRPSGTASHDQKRIMTPEAALAAGSDYLVIGRPITQATDPLRTLQDICKRLN
jgi:orotidine-5'-phosphate decarboxylase